MYTYASLLVHPPHNARDPVAAISVMCPVKKTASTYTPRTVSRTVRVRDADVARGRASRSFYIHSLSRVSTEQ